MGRAIRSQARRHLCRSRTKFPTRYRRNCASSSRARKKSASTKRQTEDAEAYRLYLQGRHHWNRWTEDGFYKAIEYFQQAVEKDPSYALAHTGVADSYVLLGWNSYLPPKDAFPKAKIAAQRGSAPRSGSRRSPHASGRRIVASRLAVAGGSDGIQTQPRAQSQLSHRQSLVRRISDDHGPS